MRFEFAGSDVDDAKVGKAAVAVDPVVEEPAQVFVGELLKRVFEG